MAASADRPAVERRVELLEGAAQVGTAKQGFTQLQAGLFFYIKVFICNFRVSKIRFSTANII